MKLLHRQTYFTKKLLLWHKNDNKRTMPWKGEKDPYKIWLSEIILQQTRVEQGLPYYFKFINNYPTINKLAQANDNDIFKNWEGLGYYSRCKNLIFTARKISYELNGVFPSTFENILALKGVGPYTAAAIASFAYNLPNAVVDGNVLRVLARFFGKKIAIDSTLGRLYFTKLAQHLLDKKNPSTYNQAIMDFGATICKPKQPFCFTCTLAAECIAYKKNMVNILPVKEKKLTKTKRYFYYVIAEYENEIYVEKRKEKDIWQNLWQFILIEEQKEFSLHELELEQKIKNIVGEYKILNISTIHKQQLTHQTIEGFFIQVKLKVPLKISGLELHSRKKIASLAFPRFITNYMEQNK